jgi:hypothetical protein
MGSRQENTYWAPPASLPCRWRRPIFSPLYRKFLSLNSIWYRAENPEIFFAHFFAQMVPEAPDQGHF